MRVKRDELKVLHIIDHMGLGGAQTAVENYLKFRPPDRIIALKYSGEYTARNSLTADPRFVFRGVRNPLDYLSLVYFLIKTIVFDKFAIIHCHLINSWRVGLILKRLLPKKVKIVFHERGIIFHRIPTRDSYKKMVKKCLDKGDIVAISKFVTNRMEQYGVNTGSVHLLYNGIDLDHFKPPNSLPTDETNKFGKFEGKFVVGYAGRIRRYKGCLDFVSAISLDESGEVCGLMAGAGPFMEDLKQHIAGSGMMDRIMLLGHIADMLQFYHSVDCIVMPSYLEPMGRIQLEAQACGVPVIATNVEGMSETISSNNALLVPPKNARAIYEAIKMLKENEELCSKLVTEGLKNVEKFALHAHMIKLNNFYRSLYEAI